MKISINSLIESHGAIRSGAMLGVVGFFCSLFVGLALEVMGLMGRDVDQSEPVGMQAVASLLVISPAVETGVIFLLVKLVSGLASKQLTWVFTGLVLAGIHSLFSPLWGLIVLIPFLIYSKISVIDNLQFRVKFKKIFVAHAVNNLIVLLVMACIFGVVIGGD